MIDVWWYTNGLDIPSFSLVGLHVAFMTTNTWIFNVEEVE